MKNTLFFLALLGTTGAAHAGEIALEDHRLELLMTYTVFHIGLYMSLVAALIAAVDFEHNPFPPSVTKWAIGLFVIAGACGGVIAVNIAEFDVTKHCVDEFYHAYNLRMWTCQIPYLRYIWLGSVEHAAFWLGVGVLLCTFFSSRRKAKCR